MMDRHETARDLKATAERVRSAKKRADRIGMPPVQMSPETAEGIAELLLTVEPPVVVSAVSVDDLVRFITEELDVSLSEWQRQLIEKFLTDG